MNDSFIEGQTFSNLKKPEPGAYDSCRFINCDFSGADLSDIKFLDCEFRGSNFGLAKLIKTSLFKNSKIIEVDFTDSDLSNSIFDNCDLQRSIFRNTNLENTDFRTSFNYSIDPEVNKIKKAKFSLLSVSGLLDKYDIEIEK